MCAADDDVSCYIIPGCTLTNVLAQLDVFEIDIMGPTKMDKSSKILTFVNYACALYAPAAFQEHLDLSSHIRPEGM